MNVHPSPLTPSPDAAVKSKFLSVKQIPISGYPIRYFPSDFRLIDPELPVEGDPKCFTHNGETYYLPFETTMCLNDRWFYSAGDTGLKTVDELAGCYRRATAENNVFVLNSPPTPQGVMPPENRRRLVELRAAVGVDLI